MKAITYPEFTQREVKLPTFKQLLHHKVRVVRPDSEEAIADRLKSHEKALHARWDAAWEGRYNAIRK